MPKHNNDLTHYFITRALTKEDVNLSIYNNEDFKTGLRLVAIDSILAILHNIDSRQVHAKSRGEEFSLTSAINVAHPITGLSMLDYCLVAGFDQMAIELIRNGAISNNLNAFERNIQRTFSNGSEQPEILNNIYTIINGCMEIKQNYDQFVAKNNAVMPKIIAAGKRIYQGYSTPTLIVLGVGCVALAPVIHPLAHGASAAALISAGILPGIVSFFTAGSTNNQPHHQFTNLPQDEHAIIKSFLKIAKSTKKELQSTHETAPVTVHAHPKRKKHAAPEESQTMLLHHLANTSGKQKIKALRDLDEALRLSMRT